MVKKPSFDIVVPVYNEEKELKESIGKLANFLNNNFGDFDWFIYIVDNASTDDTWLIAKQLAQSMPKVITRHLHQKGRGRAVKYVWQKTKSDIVAYMDVDLSTDLKHFPPLVHALTGGYDLAIGSRNARGAHVHRRSLLRTITSKGYLMLIKLLFRVHFSDAQCGFKAVTRRVVEEVIPKVVDDEWFFDTELLILAEKMGYRIYEEPVTWIDNPGSTVRVMKTMQGDIVGLWRLFRTRPWLKKDYGRN